LFDAIPIGLGDFRPKWETCWPSLRPQLLEFSGELATIAHCGSSFASDVLHQIECLAATADASDTMSVVGSIASRVLRIPGSIPHLSFAPEITAFIAVVRSDRADVGLLEVPVEDGETLNGTIVREMVVERYLRVVVSTYFRSSRFSMLYGAIKYAVGCRKSIISFIRFARRQQIRASLKKQICQAVLAQSFILPIANEKAASPRPKCQLTS
jgi:hypothetical protein